MCIFVEHKQKTHTMTKQMTEAYELGRTARMNGFLGAPVQNKDLMQKVCAFGKDFKGANKLMRSWLDGYIDANLKIVRNQLLNLGA